MNKKRFFMMKTALAFFMVLCSVWGWGQTTIFTETMGTGASGNPSATNYTGFANYSTLTFRGDADVRNNTASSYSGASGGNNVFITNTSGRYFTISGINISNYNSLGLSFGFWKSSTGNITSSQLVVEVATDYNPADNTGTFTSLTYPTVTTGSAWSMVTINGGVIPSSANLAIRFRQNQTTQQVRIDDVKLVGVAPTCTTSTFSFNSPSINKVTGDAPFTNTFTTNNTSPTVYSSNNTGVATVDTSSGVVTVVGAGNATISVAQIADGTHCAVSASYSLTVTSSSPQLAISGVPTDHGSSCPGVPNTKVQYTITNSGAAAAAGLNVTSSDPQFVVSNLSTSTIAAGGTATFDVVFTPSSSGSKTATLTATSTTSGSNTSTIVLTGKGNATVEGAVTTSAETNLGSVAVQLNGNVNTLGTCPATQEKGFAWGANADPTVSDNSTTVSGVATGPYSYTLSGLTANTVYHYRAYVKDANNVYTYGADRQFTTLAVADHLAFVNVPATGNVGSNLSSFNVEARRPDNSVDTNYTGNVVLSKASGAGVLSGTITKAFVNGIATFIDIQFDSVGLYSLSANNGILETITSSEIAITKVPTYKKITSLDDLTDGEYLLADATDKVIMTNALSSGAFGVTSVSPVNNEIINPIATTVWSIVKTGTNYVVQNVSDSKYLNYVSSTNLSGVTAVATNNQKWVITYNTDHFSIISAADNTRLLKYNSALSIPGFKAYTTSTQSPEVSLYKKVTNTTWTGSPAAWSNGAPTSDLPAIINEDYSGPAFEAFSLTVNEGKTLTVNSSVKTGNVTNNGTIIVANNANFVQTGTFTAGDASSFKLRRDSKAVKRQAYINWSSPMQGSAQTLKAFSYGKLADGITNQSATGTLDNRFYTYDNGVYVQVADPSVTTFTTPGTGYLIRTPNDFTTTPQVFHGQFEGKTPNSGDISYDHGNLIGGSFVLLGNPYPGAISIEDFWAANPDTTGTVYIWDSGAMMDGSGNYSGSNYSAYSSMGSVPANAIDGYIPAGQGFFVERTYIDPYIFKNSMRRGDQTGIFSKSPVQDKFWLQMTAPSGAKPQMLVGFNAAAGTGYDQGYDAKMIDNNADVLYTTVDDKKLVIDAHGIFDDADSFNLNANFSTSGNYTVGILQKEGIFSGIQNIYLKDNVTRTVTDLSAGSYTFSAEPGLQVNRFTVLFKSGTVLGTDSAAKSGITVFSSGSEVHVKADQNISAAELYDMSGRLLGSSRAGARETVMTVSYRGAVILKVRLENGMVQTRKLMLK
ncbi:hypothetical protein KSK37_08390 [Kaistella sp. DKR-2]|uniref:beta strand repeat-containing protein n=1 Tax=Kaistella soli TaxID=2849654 RepID=UPI001C25B85E|nr:hypothetical protein [Kaistella soli]MBU8883098.1 hypothetical protein [Kaistella soli]